MLRETKIPVLPKENIDKVFLKISATLPKKESPAQVFSYEIANFVKQLFRKQLQATASQRNLAKVLMQEY